MATPAWQPLPMQPPAPGQPPNTVPQNRWGSPGTAVNQGQVLPPRPMYAPPSGYPMGSPSTVMPSYGGSHQLNTSGTSAQSPSHQPQLSPAVSSGLLQAGIAAAPLSHVGHGGPPLPGYNMPSTPPPGNAMPGPPTPPVHLGQSILTAVNSGQGVFSPPGHAPPGVPPPSPGHVGSASSSVHSVHTALPPGVGSCSAPPSHTGNNASLPGQPGYITPGQALPGAFLPGPPPGAPPPGHSGAPAPPNIATTAPPHAPLGLPPPGHSAPSAPPVHVATTSTSSSNTVPSSPLAAGQAVSNSVLPPGQATSPVPPSPSHTGSSVPPPPGHPGSLGPPSGAGYGPFQASFSGMWQSTNMGPPGFGPPGSTPPPIPLGARPPVDASLLGARPGVPLTNSSSNQGMMPMPSPAVVQQPVYQPYHSGPALGPPQPLGPWMGPPQVPPQQPPPYALYHNPYVSPYSSQPPPVGPPDGIYISGPQASHVPQFKPPGVPGEAASQATSGQPLGMWGHSTPVPGTPLHTSTKDGGEPVDNNSSGAESASPPVPGVPGLSEKDDSATGTGEKLEVTGKEGAEVGDSWTAHKTLDGTLYYYNAVTGQSTYDKPAGFKGEPEKVTAQPTPVSWERINGTDWALVITNDGKKYYYNTVTQVTSWQVPSEVTEFRKKKVSEEVVSKQGPDNTPGATVADKGTVSFTLNMPAVSSGSRESIGYKGIVPTGATALDLIKKKLQDFGSPVTTNTTSTGPSPSGVTNGSSAGDSNNGKVIVPEENRETPKGTVDASSSDTSSESDDEVPEPSKEERVLQFKDMLKEKGVAPFSKWEKELPKIIFDPRFKAIPSHTERRSIFEHYVRTRADEERKEKRAAQKAAIEGFKQLLEESIKDISHSTDYEGFAKLWSHDSRFEALDRKDREALLNERVLPLRRAEEERLKAVHAAAVAGFNSLLKEKGEISTSTRWSKVKDMLRHDSRYRAVKREDREAFFNDYVGELRAAEREAERAAKAKREEEEKLREKEREMRKRKEREEQEMERVRAKARRKDAVSSYQALLTEKIKDPEASWTENKPKLEKDPLGRAANPELDLADRERLFREHVNELYERCVREYRLLLADVITPDAAAKQLEDGKSILTSWSEAKKALKSDPRYNRMPRRDRESWWRKYAEDVQRRLKAASSVHKDDKQVVNSEMKDSSSEAMKRSPGSRRHQSRR